MLYNRAAALNAVQGVLPGEFECAARNAHGNRGALDTPAGAEFVQEFTRAALVREPVGLRDFSTFEIKFNQWTPPQPHGRQNGADVKTLDICRYPEAN